MNLELLLNDGHWIVGKNILSYLDPESLANVGYASKTAKKFVLSYLEKDLEEKYKSNILDLDTTKSTMSEYKWKFDGEKWAEFFALVKNGSIRQMSMIMPLIKNTDRTIETFNRFRPELNLSYHMLCNDEVSDETKVETWKAFTSFLSDYEMIFRRWFFDYANWDAMMGLVLTSKNEFVVRILSEKMLEINPLKFIRDTRSFSPYYSTSGLKIDLIGKAKKKFYPFWMTNFLIEDNKWIIENFPHLSLFFGTTTSLSNDNIFVQNQT